MPREILIVAAATQEQAQMAIQRGALGYCLLFGIVFAWFGSDTPSRTDETARPVGDGAPTGHALIPVSGADGRFETVKVDGATLSAR